MFAKKLKEIIGLGWGFAMCGGISLQSISAQETEAGESLWVLVQSGLHRKF